MKISNLLRRVSETTFLRHAHNHTINLCSS